MKQALIVDTSIADREMLSGLLEKEGIAVEIIPSNEDVKLYLKRMRVVPDVIFIADMRPGAEGYEAAKYFKADERTENIPRVMCSARGRKIFYGQAAALGAVDVMSKPATIAGVKKVLGRVQISKKEKMPEVVVTEIHNQTSH